MCSTHFSYVLWRDSIRGKPRLLIGASQHRGWRMAMTTGDPIRGNNGDMDI